MSKFSIELETSTLTLEQKHALLVLIGISTANVEEENAPGTQTVITFPKADGKGKNVKTPTQPVNPFGGAAPVAPTQPVNPFGGAAPVAPTQPVNPFGGAAPVAPTQPVNPFGGAAPVAPTQPVNPFGGAAPVAPTQPVNPFGGAAPVAPTQPVNPFGGAAPVAPTQPVNPFGGAAPVAPTIPSGNRIVLSPDQNSFTYDGAPITPNAIRMATGVAVVSKGKRDIVTQKCNELGYADVVAICNAWETYKNATHAAQYYEFLKTIV